MEMTKKIGLPDKGEEIKLITTKGINAAYLMLNILDQKGPAEEIYLAMFRINVQGVEILETLMAEKKNKTDILCFIHLDAVAKRLSLCIIAQSIIPSIQH